MADNEIRIKDLTESANLADGDNFVIDNPNSRGTKRFPYSEFKKLTPLIFNNWTPLTTYQKDAFVTYEGKLYHNKTDSSVNAQTWQGSSVWEEVVLDDYLLNIVKNFVPLYSGGTTYKVSDYVVRGYKLYRCKTDGATGEWDSSKWNETNIISFIKNIVLSNFSTKRITPGVAESVSKGEIYIIKDYMYRAKADTTTDPLDMSKWETVTVENLLTDMADEIEESIEPSIETALALGTASGSIASFTDGSTLPMKKLEVDIAPVQDLHGYDNPWVGGSGKNKFDGETKNGYIYNGTYYASDDYWCNKNDIPVKPNTTYIFSGVVSNGQICCYNSSKQYTGDVFSPNVSFTTPSNCAYISIYNPISTVGNNKQLEEGSTATSYAPYSNICPISGWDECKVSDVSTNVWDEETKSGYYDVTTGSYVSNANQLCSKDYISVRPNMTLYGYKGSYTGYGELLFYDAENNYIDYLRATQWINKEFTIPSNCYYITFNLGSAYGATYNHDISINYPSTDISYHAYNGQTYTIDLDGTRYGGTLDVVRGVLTVDRAIASGKVSSIASNTYTNIVYGKLAKPTDSMNYGNTGVHDLISSMYYVDSATYNWDDANKIGKMFVGADYNALWIGFPIGTTLAEMQSITENNKICYKLATPTTIQLTPTEVKTLLATNNIFADTGDILDATYVRNANITINDLIRRIENLENA